MKTKYLKFISIAFAASVAFASCSQDFLEAKQNYDKTNSEIYNTEAGADGRVRDVYARCLPNPEFNGENWQYVSWGVPDDLSRATEEYYAGSRNGDSRNISIWADGKNRPLEARGANAVKDYFIGGSNGDINSNSYGLIRHINEAINGIEHGNLSQDIKNKYLGQLYFFRAWRYFILWKWYGGVPRIDFVPEISPSSVTPRASAKVIYEFIISDLKLAAELLEPFTKELTNTENYGRVNMGTALALKGRVMAWWCSPLFNRTQDVTRYSEALKEMQADLAKIEECGYSLYPAQSNNAAGWADMFQIITPANTEAVFFARLNNLIPEGSAIYRTNFWERHIRPYNAHCASNQGVGTQPAATIVDIFPMADGKVPTNDYYTAGALEKSKYTYNTGNSNHSLPFMNRDPRFYRTFGFPGIKWPVNGTITWNDAAPYPEGSDYELWNYVWYEKEDQIKLDDSGNNYGADYLMSNVKGMYITKKSGSDLSHQNYILTSGYGFRRSAASLIELRFAEVLLNLAEVAAGAGQTAEAYGYLKQIRERVGYTGDCGLNTSGSQNQCMAAVLYERQIELAFEGKRFDDMRRWLLFDGGTNMPGTKLTGWNGNTCTWLGVKPFNGTRRESMEFRVNDATKKGLGGKAWAATDKIPDPIAQTVMEENDWTNSDDNTIFDQYKKWRSENYAVDLNGEDLEGQLNKLKEFYDKYLVYKFKRGDASIEDDNKNKLYNENTTVQYLPYYYFIGLHGGALDANPTLRQTIGWDGGPTGQGDFDPLAE